MLKQIISALSLFVFATQGKLWIVSDSDEDDNGESGQSRWYGKDAVWPIPEIK
jgi:hypothetical protein